MMISHLTSNEIETNEIDSFDIEVKSRIWDAMGCYGTLFHSATQHIHLNVKMGCYWDAIGMLFYSAIHQFRLKVSR